jgi:nucleoside-diphosphate-sugar epimerase
MISKMLIAGASGLVGGAVVDLFAQRADWQTVAVSRRKPAHLPKGVTHLAVDLLDRRRCAEVFGALHDVTHVVFAAVNEKPDDLVAGWSDPEQIRRNGDMLENLFEPLSAVAKNLRHVSILQGAKAYGVHLPQLGRPTIPLRERMPRPPHPNFYFLHEDYIKRKQQGSQWHWSILRSNQVVGGGIGSNLNTLLAIGVFGAVRKAAGQPLCYPGIETGIGDMIDVELMAQCLEWAATSPAARNEVFNISNGDVFTWHGLWPVIADAMDMPVGPPQRLSVAEEMQRQADAWAALVRQHCLAAPEDLRAFVGESFWLADLNFSMPVHVLVDTVKLRRAGFHECIDSEDMVAKWFRRWQDRRLLPAP